ncbi:hypothetical protein [Shewanella halotolerans]|uniref:hypothetical protein n=1 Tax=Shewanella halotolerans TaxID=2864204 RepID=UPI001C659F81|nr:hypothetical protein [Shewanella halotolerans]QYJ88418.1 hypothetical protein K0H81_11375 [Shewanella halotolerans]
MEFEFIFKERKFLCYLNWYDWAHGIGVKASFTEEARQIGAIQFLCDKSNEHFEDLISLSKAQIFDALATALVNNRLDSSIQSMIEWQKAVNANGFDKASPIISQLSNAF